MKLEKSCTHKNKCVSKFVNLLVRPHQTTKNPVKPVDVISRTFGRYRLFKYPHETITKTNFNTYIPPIIYQPRQRLEFIFIKIKNFHGQQLVFER